LRGGSDFKNSFLKKGEHGGKKGKKIQREEKVREADEKSFIGIASCKISSITLGGGDKDSSGKGIVSATNFLRRNRNTTLGRWHAKIQGYIGGKNLFSTRGSPGGRASGKGNEKKSRGPPRRMKGAGENQRGRRKGRKKSYPPTLKKKSI